MIYLNVRYLFARYYQEFTLSFDTIGIKYYHKQFHTLHLLILRRKTNWLAPLIGSTQISSQPYNLPSFPYSSISLLSNMHITIYSPIPKGIPLRVGKVTFISKRAATIHVEERAKSDLFLDLLTAADELSALGIGTFFTTVSTSDLLWAGRCVIMSLVHFLEMMELWVIC